MRIGNFLTGGLGLSGLLGNLTGLAPTGTAVSTGGMSGTGGTGLAPMARRVAIGGLTAAANGTGVANGVMAAMSPNGTKYMPNTSAGMVSASKMSAAQTKEFGDQMQEVNRQSAMETIRDELQEAQLKQMTEGAKTIGMTIVSGAKDVNAVASAQ